MDWCLNENCRGLCQILQRSWSCCNSDWYLKCEVDVGWKQQENPAAAAGNMNKSQHPQCGEPEWGGRRWPWTFHSTSCAEGGQDGEVQGKRETPNSTARLASAPAVSRERIQSSRAQGAEWGHCWWQECPAVSWVLWPCHPAQPQLQIPFLEGILTFPNPLSFLFN